MNSQNKEKKKGTPWGILIVIAFFLIGQVAEGNAIPGPAIFLIVVFMVIALVAAIGKSQKKRQQEEMEKRAESRPQPKVELHRPVPSMQRREPATASAQRSFPKPEAYCVSCEASGEDHFVRDRNRRIAQLDDWLKNGLIDRQEYLVLKRRFQNDQ